MDKAKKSQRMNLSTLLVGALISAAGVACSSGDPAKIGDPVAVDKNALASYAASWEGYVEAFTFLSGSDHLRISLDKDGNGWLQVGDSADLLPGPTDPSVAWPPVYAGMTYDASKGLRPERLVDGFRYPIVGAKVEAERIRLSIDPYAAFAAWCAIQTPVFVDSVLPTTYKCSNSFAESQNGNCATSGPNSSASPIDCGKAHFCSALVCECDANACKAAKCGATVTFDVALIDEAGSKLEGSILMPGESDSSKGGPYTIRLKR